MNIVTTRNLDSGEHCQICGECKRCQHYHDLRDALREARKAIRRLVAAGDVLLLSADLVAHADDGDDDENPHSVAARRVIGKWDASKAAALQLLGTSKEQP